MRSSCLAEWGLTTEPRSGSGAEGGHGCFCVRGCHHSQDNDGYNNAETERDEMRGEGAGLEPRAAGALPCPVPRRGTALPLFMRTVAQKGKKGLPAS